MLFANISLVSNQAEDRLRQACVLVQFIEPKVDSFEGLAVVDSVRQNCNLGLPVVQRLQRTKFLSATSVPNVKFD